MPKIQVNGIKQFYRIFCDGKEQFIIDSDKTVMLVYHGGPGIVDHQMELDLW